MADVKISALPASTTPLVGTEILPIVQSGITKKVTVVDLTANRSVSGTSFVPTGSAVPNNGMFLGAANSVSIATNSTEHWMVNASGNLNPVGSKGIGTALAAVNGVYTTDATLTTGNLVIGTSGKGIDFSATSDGSGTMTSELLADYEEGTFTPVLNNFTLGGAQTYTITGRYTKIGRLVFIDILIDCTGTTTITATEDSSYISGLPYSVGANQGNTFGVNRTTTSTSLGVGSFAGTNMWVPGWAASPAAANIGLSGSYTV